MEQYIMRGGNPLKGEVTIGGAKNAALGLLAAAIIADEPVAVSYTHLPTRKYGKFRIRSFLIFLLSITDHAPVSSLEPSSEIGRAHV